MTPTLIYSSAGNATLTTIAMRYGFKPGARLNGQSVYFPPYFCDQEYQAFRTATDEKRQKMIDAYMSALAAHRPNIASVLDLESAWQFDEVMRWVHEASQHVLDAVIVIPKVRGLIRQLPRRYNGKEIRLGFSIKTRHGGTDVHPSEFLGWPVHLLGGAPEKQIAMAQAPHSALNCERLNVVSVDMNYMQQRAMRNQFWFNGMAYGTKNRYMPQLSDFGYFPETDSYKMAFELSCLNIRAAWHGCPVGLRYATDADLPQVVKIARQYKHELSAVCWPKLRESAARRELLVAEYGDTLGRYLVGFVHWHARRDGWNTVYEIATHKDWRGCGIGRALLGAVPKPMRLKVTTDNTTAIDFYERAGLQVIRREDGRKRPLYVMEAA